MDDTTLLSMVIKLQEKHFESLDLSFTCLKEKKKEMEA